MNRLLLLLAVSCGLHGVTDAGLAAMSIDLGSQYLKVGLVKTGVPMEIVLTKESRRKMPNLLSIRNGERMFADAAAALALKYPQNAFPHLLQLIAKKDGDPAVSHYKGFFPFSTLTVAGGDEGVRFSADGTFYDVETLLAMILWSAKQMTEAHAGQSVKDVVIAIPAFFTQAERRAVTVAADIAGLNLLQLISDGSAAALNYGVFRRKEVIQKPLTMLIYDMGAAKTAATVVELIALEDKDQKEQVPTVRTIGYGFDRTLGGLEMTLRLQKQLENAFRAEKKTPTDIATSGRSMARLHKEAERVKQVLSANTKTFAQIENLHEDTDFRYEVTRDVYEDLLRDLQSRIEKVAKDALSSSGKNMEELDTVVLMGAGTRSPFVKKVLENHFQGKELSNFLNTDEAIALGAVYQSARLSNSFKVLPFNVQEMVTSPIQVNFMSKTEEGIPRPSSKTLFPYGSFYPSAKKIVTFHSYNDDFDFSFNYAALDHLDETQLKEHGKLNVSRVSVSKVKENLEEAMKVEGSQLKGLKVHVSLDQSGVLKLHKVELNVEQPPPVPTPEEVAAKEKKEEEDAVVAKAEKENATEEGQASGDKKEETAGAERTRIEKAPTENQEAPDQAKETKEDKKVNETAKTETKPVKKEEPKPKKIRVELPIREEELDYITPNPDRILNAKAILKTFENAEKVKHAREEAMNALETAIYDLGGKLEYVEGVVEFMTDEEKKKLKEELETVRVWHDEESGAGTPTDDFITKRKQLEDTVEKGEARKKEFLGFPKIEEKLLDLFNHTEIFLAQAALITSNDTVEELLFTETEISTLESKHKEVKEWFVTQKVIKSAQTKTEDPVLTIQHVEDKAVELHRELKYLLNKLMNYKSRPKKTEKEKKKEETEPKTEKTSDPAKESKKTDGDQPQKLSEEESMFEGLDSAFQATEEEKAKHPPQTEL